MTLKQLDIKREYIKGKVIVGVDPSQDKHQMFVIDSSGFALCKSFSISKSNEGFRERLWINLRRHLIPQDITPENIVFAIEVSVDFWQTLADYLHREGYTVVLVSPLATKKSRSLPGNDFSRTDQKDARLVAENAFRGHYHFYEDYSERSKAMKTLSLTYNKLRKDLSGNYLRLRSMLNRVFPEFPGIVPLNTDTAFYLLTNYLHPNDFLTLNIGDTVEGMMKVSQKQHGMETLLKLQEAAKNTIGIPKNPEEIMTDRFTVDAWLVLINTLKEQMKIISGKLIEMAKENYCFNILTSVKGISDLSASLFLAELRDISKFHHFKQIQKFAGLNLRLNDSGKGHGRHIINRLGNKRLRWIIYWMARETAKYIPEVRIRYLKRQIKNSNYTKNVIAVSSQLLQLLMALIKAKRTYEYRIENELIMLDLEHQYNLVKKRKKKKSNNVYQLV